MLLSLRNVGRIKEADIEIDGITVIAGENNSGKSTVSKSLFCILNSFYRIDKQIATVRFWNLYSYLSTFGYAFGIQADKEITKYFRELSESIVEKRDEYLNDGTLLKSVLQSSTLGKRDEKYVSDVHEKIIDYLKVPDDEILHQILRHWLKSEFNMQVNNLNIPNLDSSITLQINGDEVSAIVERNEVVKINGGINPYTEAIYIDDPYLIDNLDYIRTYRRYFPLSEAGHRDILLGILYGENPLSRGNNLLDEIINSKRLKNVFEKLNLVCAGEAVMEEGKRFAYRENKEASPVDALNISAGLKIFIIIKMLLLNGTLKEKGTIILDEPEIHLHPEWQLVFAELIVLIQKEFNLHVLINTHSPYFLDAIETYSRKHKIADKCRYYLSELSNNTACIADVSGNIEKIYAKLARPLQVLENERYPG